MCSMEYIGDIEYDEALRRDDLNLVIFGAGQAGRKILEFLRINGKEQNVKFFCDRNPKLWETRIEDIPVVEPLKLCKDNREFHFLVGGQYVDEMAKILQDEGINRIHMLLV